MGNKISTIATPKQKIRVSYPVHDKKVVTPSNDDFEDFVEIKNEDLVDLTDPTLIFENMNIHQSNLYSIMTFINKYDILEKCWDK